MLKKKKMSLKYSNDLNKFYPCNSLQQIRLKNCQQQADANSSVKVKITE